MPKLNSIIICDEVKMIPGEKVIINGVFDSIYAENFPAIHPSLTIYVRMEVDENEKDSVHKHSYEIKREDDNKVIFTHPEQEFITGGKRHQLIHKVDDFYLEKEGKYIVNIFIDGEPFATTYFFAKRISNSDNNLCLATKKAII